MSKAVCEYLWVAAGKHEQPGSCCGSIQPLPARVSLCGVEREVTYVKETRARKHAMLLHSGYSYENREGGKTSELDAMAALLANYRRGA